MRLAGWRLALLICAAPALARTATVQPSADCLTHASKVASPPKFADFPAGPIDRRASLRLTTPEARLFRTNLRRAVATGPNFAGHYVVATWGCGSSCGDIAIVEARSGRVTFDPRLRDVSTVRVGDDGTPTLMVRFRVDSRLLVLVGAPHENDEADGVRYYEMRDGRLRLLRFVPRLKACLPG
jgi:hypothetical protein